MVRKKVVASPLGELEAAKLESMRIRFRRVLGETVPAHVVKNARKNIANCVRTLKKSEMRGKNA